MKHILRLIIPLLLPVCSLCAQDTDYILDFGFHRPWTARVLFNPTGGTRSPYHQWEDLYELRPADTVSIQMPSTADAYNEVAFRTPISVAGGTTYSFSIVLCCDQGINLNVALQETGGQTGSVLLQRTLTLTAGRSRTLTVSRFRATADIQNLELQLAATGAPDARITLTGATLTDTQTGKNLLNDTPYYNYTYCLDPSTNQETYGATLSGRRESLSWTLPDLDDSLWDTAAMPIGNSAFSVPVQTVWQGSEYNNYWIRRTFTLDDVKSSTQYTLRVCHDDSYRVYVNGHKIDEAANWTTDSNYVSFTIPSSYLQTGTNVIATYIQQNYGGCFYDCALMETPNAYADGQDIRKLRINEIQVANIDQYLDYSYNYGAWLEFYNPTLRPISIAGMYVSDDSTNLMKAMLPADYDDVPAGGYLNIWFDNNSRKGEYGPYAYKQVDLKLDDEGGTLYFSDAGGNLLFSFSYPAAIARCSWARTSTDADEWAYCGAPTPQAANTGGGFASQRLNAPEPDTDSRLFTEAFTVNVPIPAGTLLRYTTDGSAPTLQNGSRSTTGRFRISGTTILRLRLFRGGYLPSAVVTRSYIYRDRDYYLPVISIASAPDNLYGDSIGVYTDGVNGISGRNYGKSNLNMDWERPVNFEYITPGDSMGVNQEAEFSVSGGWSRHYAPASFKIKASNIYESQGSINYPFFPLKPYNRYKEILIRNGGNDNASTQYGRVRDAITQQVLLKSGFRVDAQDYQPVHLFINGSYIGQMNLREPSNRYNGTANYGFDKDSIDAFEYSNGYYQKAGTDEAFRRWVSLSTGAADSAVYERLRGMVDMDEVINYFAAISYIGSSDWILNNNNAKGYRPREEDGKFHLVLFDQDWGWSNNNGVVRLGNSRSNDLVNIYNNMRRNPRFARQFINAYCLLAGSVFTAEHSEAIGDSVCALVEPALKMENREPRTSFNLQKPEMTQGQAARIRALRTAYSLGEGMQVSLKANIPSASLMLDQQPIPYNTFSGTLFAPVTITATAPAGYVFRGWQSSASTTATLFSAGSAWDYYDQGPLDSRQWTAPTYSTSSWNTGNAPLGYDTRNEKTIATTLSYGSNPSNKRPTYYFRKSFRLDDTTLADSARFTLSYTVDDGFVLYVNGQEVCRYLMPDGNVSYSTYATTYAQSNPDTGSLEIPSSCLRGGENVIAVEVHNNSATSTDIYWDAALTVSTSGATAISASNKLVLAEDQDGDYTAIFEPLDDTQARYDAGGTPLRINEVSAANDIFQNDYYKKSDWLELYNTTDQDIDLKGMYLSDNANKPHKYQIPRDTEAGTVVPAHGTLVLWADKRNDLTYLHLPLRLDNADGSIVSITAEDGNWADVLTYNSHSGRESFGRYPDGGNTTYKMYVPTINKANQLSTYDFDADLLGTGDNSYVQTTLELARGWNWLSHNLSSAFLPGRFLSNADALRSQTGRLRKDSTAAWAGNIYTVLPATGYKLHALSPYEITLTGNYFDLQQDVSVRAGWNWIGCPLPNATNLSASLTDYSPQDGDEIVGQTGFSVFSDGEWEGTLTSLAPGNAYMLYSHSAQSFRWKAVAPPAGRVRRYSSSADAPESETWSADPQAYPDVMTMIATLRIDQDSADVSQYTAGAFVGNECRGVGEVVDGQIYMNIYGEASEPITFKIMDKSGQVMDAEQQPVFAALTRLGSRQSPYVISALTIGIHSIDADNARVERIDYFNAQGQRVSPSSKGFLIKVTTYQNGRKSACKLIRK